MSCAYNAPVINKVKAYLDSGQQVFWKVYAVNIDELTGYGHAIRPPYMHPIKGAVVVADGYVYSDREEQEYAGNESWNSEYDVIQQGIHVFVNREDAISVVSEVNENINPDVENYIFIVVPVFADKADLVGAGFHLTSDKNGVIMCNKETAVFMKIRLEKRSLLNSLIETLGRRQCRTIRQIMANTFKQTVKVEQKTPELVEA